LCKGIKRFSYYLGCHAENTQENLSFFLIYHFYFLGIRKFMNNCSLTPRVRRWK